MHMQRSLNPIQKVTKFRQIWNEVKKAHPGSQPNSGFSNSESKQSLHPSGESLEQTLAAGIWSCTLSNAGGLNFSETILWLSSGCQLGQGNTNLTNDYFKYVYINVVTSLFQPLLLWHPSCLQTKKCSCSKGNHKELYQPFVSWSGTHLLLSHTGPSSWSGTRRKSSLIVTILPSS